MKPSADELNTNTSKIGQIVERPPGELKPWPGNPRTHSDKQLAKLKASIQTFGFTAPVLVDEAGVILSGHGRVQAAKALGLTTIPTRVMAGLSEAKKRAYVIADNKIAQLSGWDQTLLKSELEILIREEFEIEATGFTTAEIDLMFDAETAGGSDPDDLQQEDIRAEVVSRPGDLWQLGHHRLLCGDALSSDSYRALLGAERAQLVVSDPPYNVPIAGHVCGTGKVKHKEFAMAAGRDVARSSSPASSVPSFRRRTSSAATAPCTSTSWTGGISASSRPLPCRASGHPANCACGSRTTPGWAPSTAASTNSSWCSSAGRRPTSTTSSSASMGATGPMSGPTPASTPSPARGTSSSRSTRR